MAKKRNWSYGSSSNQQCGRMQCSACNKPIKEGFFRYYMAYDRWFNDTGYVTQHRACSEQDPNWQKLENEQKQREDRNALFLEACIEFKAKWGVDELDELISDLTP